MILFLSEVFTCLKIFSNGSFGYFLECYLLLECFFFFAYYLHLLFCLVILTVIFPCSLFVWLFSPLSFPVPFLFPLKIIFFPQLPAVPKVLWQCKWRKCELKKNYSVKSFCMVLSISSIIYRNSSANQCNQNSGISVSNPILSTST